MACHFTGRMATGNGYLGVHIEFTRTPPSHSSRRQQLPADRELRNSLLKINALALFARLLLINEYLKKVELSTKVF